MSISPTSFVWESYETSERYVKDFLESVPWTKGNIQVWSPKLATYLIDICSKIESAFRDALESQFLDKCDGIEDQRKKDRRNIFDYHQIFNIYHRFNKKPLMLLETNEFIVPWKDWSEKESPKWWSDYNKLKHNFFENRELATLENVVIALGGFFLICITIQEYQEYLVGIDIIKGNNAKRWIVDRLALHPEPHGELVPLVAKSDLFGYVFEPRNWNWEEIEPFNPWRF